MIVGLELRGVIDEVDSIVFGGVERKKKVELRKDRERDERLPQQVANHSRSVFYNIYHHVSEQLWHTYI